MKRRRNILTPSRKKRLSEFKEAVAKHDDEDVDGKPFRHTYLDLKFRSITELRSLNKELGFDPAAATMTNEQLATYICLAQIATGVPNASVDGCTLSFDMDQLLTFERRMLVTYATCLTANTVPIAALLKYDNQQLRQHCVIMQLYDEDEGVVGDDNVAQYYTLPPDPPAPPPARYDLGFLAHAPIHTLRSIIRRRGWDQDRHIDLPRMPAAQMRLYIANRQDEDEPALTPLQVRENELQQMWRLDLRAILEVYLPEEDWRDRTKTEGQLRDAIIAHEFPPDPLDDMEDDDGEDWEASDEESSITNMSDEEWAALFSPDNED
jgi:hypothetical protein